MMQAVVPDRREKEGIPARRIGPDIGVGEYRNDRHRAICREYRRLLQVEQRDHAEADQKQLDRVAYGAFGCVQLGTMLMRTEENTTELHSLMPNSSDGFCL